MQIKIALAQMNPVVGDLEGNADRIAALAVQAAEAGAALLLSPELVLCGYPPEDLALRSDFYEEAARVLAALAARLPAGLTAVVGHPLAEGEERYNAASVLRDGAIVAVYRKQKLPNHSVFDEVRTFTRGRRSLRVRVRRGAFRHQHLRRHLGTRPAQQARDAGAQILLVLNASPFHMNKQDERFDVARRGSPSPACPDLRQHGGRPGRTGVRRRLLLPGRRRPDHRPIPAFEEGLHIVELDAGVARGAIRSPQPPIGGLGLSGPGAGRARLCRPRTAFPAPSWACRAASIPR
jgi:NAD+ synthase (glutamine-hydrolysing)